MARFQDMSVLSEELSVHEGFPCVTLTMPTARNMPDNAQDPIRLKKLFTEAKNRLQDDLGKRPAAACLKNLETAVDSVDHDLNYEGLAIFANEVIEVVLKTRFAMEEAVMIDDRFSLRNLLRAERRAEPYSVLLLSLNEARLFEGSREDLHEVRGNVGFPAKNPGFGAGSKAPGGLGVSKESAVDESRQRFVQDCFAKCSKIEGLPTNLVVAGTEEVLTCVQSANTAPLEVLTTVPGNLIQTNVAEVGAKVWQAVRQARTERAQSLLMALDHARSEKRYAGGIQQEVVTLAMQGRVETLVCGMTYSVAGRYDEATQSLTLIDEPEVWTDQDDAVEIAVQGTMAARGSVRFIPDELMVEVPIAAVLRF